MDRRELQDRCRRRVRALLASVDLPDPWSVNEFLDRLERHRGRAIDLCAVPWTLGASSGAWRHHRDHDVIAYAENTSSLHQDHIILHEVGHMISRHRGRCALSEPEALRRAPDLAPAAFAHLFGRSGEREEEAEAEMIATEVLARIARQGVRRSPVRDCAGGPDVTATAAGSVAEPVESVTLRRITSVFDGSAS